MDRKMYVNPFASKKLYCVVGRIIKNPEAIEFSLEIEGC